MGDSCIEKVDAALADCKQIAALPPEIAGFQYTRVRLHKDAQYDFFRYDHAPLHRAVVGFFDAATNSYKLRVEIGVVSYVLPSFICGELARFGRELERYLPRVMEELCADTLDRHELLPVRDAMLAWPYGAALPAQCEGFTLFVRPSAPAALTNGSYLVIDYADFARESDVGIYYNCYRNEFFGEYHVWGMPYVSYDFDAADLAALEQRLELHLVRYLRIAAAEAAAGRPV